MKKYVNFIVFLESIVDLCRYSGRVGLKKISGPKLKNNINKNRDQKYKKVNPST